MNEGMCEAPSTLSALIASSGSVSGEETTVRFGHPGIDLDNREY
ncbi:hypothetical protein ACU8OP_26900 (plasmid) [Rhizobium leguminosarum]|nr:hypothetical protein [Rhizobium sp. PRIMUS64]